MDRTPREGGNSTGALLYHVAAIELDWLHAGIFEGEAFPPDIARWFPYYVRDESGKPSPVTTESLADHIERLDQVRAYLSAAPEGEYSRRVPACSVL